MASEHAVHPPVPRPRGWILFSTRVLSIPHTGTVFTCLTVGAMYVHILARDNGQSAFSEAADTEHVIVPVRDPALVAESWIRRRYTESLTRCWELLGELAQRRDIMLLPVDHPRRAVYLSAIARRLGEELPTDWEPARHSARPLDCAKADSLESARDHQRGAAERGYEVLDALGLSYPRSV